MSAHAMTHVLAQLNALAAQTRPGHSGLAPAASHAPGGQDFSHVLDNAVAKVNTAQLNAQSQAHAYAARVPGHTSLSSTVMAMQKADLSIKEAGAVTSRAVGAYKAIMNMPI